MMNIMNPPADWSTLKKLIWLRGTPITGGEELTVSGTPPLSLPNSLGKPLKAWEVDVLPKQDLNGYDSPWPAGGGKNKAYLEQGTLKFSTDGTEAPSTNRLRTNYIPITAKVEYYTSFNGDALVIKNGCIYDANKQYLGYGSFPDNTGKYITTNSNAKFVRLMYGASDNVDITPDNYKYQFEQGNAATSWTPYSNICPIHGTDKLTITTAGKNLLDVSTLLVRASGVYQVLDNGYVTITASDGVAWGNLPTMPIQAGTYTLSRSQTVGSCDIRLGYENYASSHVLSVGRDSMTITITQDTMLKFKGDYGYDVTYPITDCFQLELGSTASPYTTYLAPSQTVITLPSTVYNGTVGSEVGESRWKEVDLSTVRWARDGATNYWYSLDVVLASDTYINPNNSVLCSTMTLATSKPSTGDNAHCYYSGALYLEVWNDTATTQADVQNGLTGVQFIYRLDTPVQFTLTAPTIPTPKGTATAWATAEDGTVDSMSVTYVGKA